MKPKSQKISLYLPLLGGGGAERVMLNLAQGLAAKGVDLDLVLGCCAGPYVDQIPNNVNVIDLKASRALTSIPGLIGYLREAHPQALVSALDHANLVALWAKKLAGVSTRSILTIHSTLSEKMAKSPNFFRKRAFSFLLRRFYPWADAIVAVSSGVAVDFLQVVGLPREKVRVIYNPVIGPDIFERSRELLVHPWFQSGEGPVVLSVGRLTDPKDFPTLIRAFALVREERPVRLVILGEGELRSSLEGLIRDLRIQKDVDLPGFVENPFQYMAKAAVFVLSSRREGLPTVLIEAMALGAPLVATNCRSGPDEILENGTHGRLVPVGDVPALADAISESLSGGNPPAVPESWKRFEFDQVVEEYLAVIRE